MAHDWPIGEPLHLHALLIMPDGWVVDAEGRRSMEALLKSFGVKAGYSHKLIADPEWKEIPQRAGV